MKRVFVAIDGSNFYYKLKSNNIQRLIKYDYAAFVKWICKKDKPTIYTYYVGRIREEIGSLKSKKLKSQQDRLLSHLNNQGFTLKTGYILKSGNKYHEKGVDVQMAVDICMNAVRNKYDKLIIVSSDTDLIPALKEVKSLKKEIEYVGFKLNPSFALIRFSDTTTLLDKDDLIKFVKK